jgi:hypothetical protein
MKPPKDEIPDGMKWCNKCEQIHAIRNFVRDKRNTNGIGSVCKECFKNSPSHKKSMGKVKQKAYAKGWLPPWAKL